MNKANTKKEFSFYLSGEKRTEVLGTFNHDNEENVEDTRDPLNFYCINLFQNH